VAESRGERLDLSRRVAKLRHTWEQSGVWVTPQRVPMELLQRAGQSLPPLAGRESPSLGRDDREHEVVVSTGDEVACAAGDGLSRHRPGDDECGACPERDDDEKCRVPQVHELADGRARHCEHRDGRLHGGVC
jgi:hypothetical protein